MTAIPGGLNLDVTIGKTNMLGYLTFFAFLCAIIEVLISLFIPENDS